MCDVCFSFLGSCVMLLCVLCEDLIVVVQLLPCVYEEDTMHSFVMGCDGDTSFSNFRSRVLVVVATSY